MAQEISLTVDDSQFQRMVAARDPIYLAAGVSALNKASRKVRTQVIKRAATLLRMPPTPIRKRTYFRNARRNFRPHVTLLIYTKGIAISGPFRPRRTKKGVSADGGRRYPGAFVANKTAMRREGGELKVIREDIYRGVSAAAAVEMQTAGEHLADILPHELEVRLKRAAMGGS